MAKKKATTKEVTLEIAVPEFLKHLKENGKGERTVEVYGRCLENVVTFFKPDKQLGKITPALSGQFLKSDALLKKPNGIEKSPITVKQNVRVYKMMLVWANERGYLADIPLPKAEMKPKNGASKDNGHDAGERPEEAAE